MLEFQLDEEQKMLTDAIHRYSTEMVRKVFRDADEEGRIPAEVIQAGWEMGVLATSLPEAYGGFGDYSAVTQVLAAEAFGWGDLATALAVMTPNLVAIPVLLAGTEAQKEAHLPLFAEENPPKVTAALTEPRIQYDPRRLQTTAVLDHDHYVLNGRIQLALAWSGVTLPTWLGCIPRFSALSPNRKQHSQPVAAGGRQQPGSHFGAGRPLAAH